MSSKHFQEHQPNYEVPPGLFVASTDAWGCDQPLHPIHLGPTQQHIFPCCDKWIDMFRLLIWGCCNGRCFDLIFWCGHIWIRMLQKITWDVASYNLWCCIRWFSMQRKVVKLETGDFWVQLFWCCNFFWDVVIIFWMLQHKSWQSDLMTWTQFSWWDWRKNLSGGNWRKE
jgi:hypothetical protein